MLLLLTCRIVSVFIFLSVHSKPLKCMWGNTMLVHKDAPTDPASMMIYAQKFRKLEDAVTARLAKIRGVREWMLMPFFGFSSIQTGDIRCSAGSCTSMSVLRGRRKVWTRCIATAGVRAFVVHDCRPNAAVALTPPAPLPYPRREKNDFPARFPRREVQVECGRVDRAVHGPRAENAPHDDLAQGASSLFAGRGPRAEDRLSYLGPR